MCVAVGSLFHILSEVPMFMPANWVQLIGTGKETWSFLTGFTKLAPIHEAFFYRALVVIFAMAVFYIFQRSRNIFWARSALIGLFSCVFGAVYLASSSWLSAYSSSIIWYMMGNFRRLFWSLAHQFSDREYLKFRPFYWKVPLMVGGATVLKSHAFLDKFKTDNSNTLSKYQLNAVKLALWIFVLSLLLRFLGVLLGRPGFSLPAMFPENWITLDFVNHYRGFINGRLESRAVLWWSALLTFYLDLLAWTIILNLPIVFIRYFGFAIPRGVYRPLEATSIPEFFARRYYYYKELLFGLFVWPIFMKLKFIRNRKIRVFVAVTVGVGVGSALAHLLVDIPSLRSRAPTEVFSLNFPIILRGFLFGAIFGLYQFGNPLPIMKGKMGVLMRAVNLTVIVIFFSFSKIFTPVMTIADAGMAIRFLGYILGLPP